VVYGQHNQMMSAIKTQTINNKNMKEREIVISEAKKVVGEKKSEDCTFKELFEVSKRIGGLHRRSNETKEEHMERVNAFRCGW